MGAAEQGSNAVGGQGASRQCGVDETKPFLTRGQGSICCAFSTLSGAWEMGAVLAKGIHFGGAECKS